MKAPPEIPNPEGWKRPWPFASEVELWQIPEDQHAEALAWELMRETYPLNNPPEACLSPKMSEFESDLFRSFNPDETMPRAPFLVKFQSAEKSEIWERCTTLRMGLGSTYPEPLIIGEMKEYFELGEIIGLHYPGKYHFLDGGLAVNLSYSRAQIVEAFNDYLKDLEASGKVTFSKPTRGRSSSDAKALLASLSLMRLRENAMNISPLKKFWQWIEGTPFQWWESVLPDEEETESERIERITRQASEKIRNLESRLRKEAEAVGKYLSHLRELEARK